MTAPDASNAMMITLNRVTDVITAVQKTVINVLTVCSHAAAAQQNSNVNALMQNMVTALLIPMAMKSVMTAIPLTMMDVHREK